ncbi:MAG: hypothetical protein M1830_004685 [Pleopsidium flavum]|nr:MAG: hypothetical protein M1830_004685 [Pleopsidium flavum]
MESSPLILGHSHARKALQETRKSNSSAASEEHDLAAGEFANAAKDTGDAEASRTLRLLEEHHHKLAQLLKFRTSHQAATANTEAARLEAAPAAPSPQKSPNILSDTPRSSSPYRNSQQPPLLQPHHRGPPRDLTSSIASNLASARGIPAKHQRRSAPISPTLSAQHAGGKMLGPPGRSRLGDPKDGALSGSVREKTTQGQQPSSPPAFAMSKVGEKKGERLDGTMERQRSAIDEPFQRFYSTFEGLLSKLSAPLAFAGLPLRPDETALPESQNDIPEGVEEALVEPDVTRIFSKAALRAVKEESGGYGFGGAESFYVVPTTGGTISYAGILSRAERARLENDDHADEFVDARETPVSPNTKRNTKTMEELQLENQALRALSDQLSKRLHMWEVNAQSSSMALQQSLRAIGGDEKVKELEEQITAGRKEMEKIGRENEKLRGVVARYRDKWEKLKQGARDRREGSVDI